MMGEFRLYNKLNCTLFDLLGSIEPNQTKALGFVLSRSDDAMRALLKLLFPSNNPFVTRLMSYKRIVHCELSSGSSKSLKGRADIVVGFFDGVVPQHALVIECKSISILASPAYAAIQVARYSKLNFLRQFQPKDVSLVTLTTNIDMSPSLGALASVINNVISITWNLLIAEFQKLHNDIIVDQFVNYLIQNNIMNLYDVEVLCIPAGNTYTQIQQYGLYECPTRGRQYKSRGLMHPLYLSFRKKGKFNVLYKVLEVVAIDLNDPFAITTLDNKYPNHNIKSRINGYVGALKPVGQKWLFILDIPNSIDLGYNVTFKRPTRGMAGHVRLSLKDILTPPHIIP